jgi:hypothetical protein
VFALLRLPFQQVPFTQASYAWLKGTCLYRREYAVGRYMRISRFAKATQTGWKP